MRTVSTPLPVFKKIAKREKTSTGYFYGFQLHLIIDDKGKILAYMLTPGNMEAQVPAFGLSKKFFGKMFADKGYISHPLFIKLYEKGLRIITRLIKNMKSKLILLVKKILLRK
ncbi:hypothetical protein NEOC65_000098 [Neochlamydia sp. AcF65]|nr:hypothetical protein [Neochlamydia sp. AcF65]